MKRILLTGAAGFIGYNAIKWFQQDAAYQVVSVVDALTYAGIHKQTIEDDKNITPFWFDIATVNWNYVLQQTNPDIIINMAAESHVDNSLEEDMHEIFMRSNVLGVLKIINAVRNYKDKTGKSVYVIQVSTDEVLGSFSLSSWEEADEFSTLCPNNPYSATKAMAELGIAALYRSYKDFDYTIVRATNNYGHGQHLEKFIPKAMENAFSGKPIPVYGTGANIREWLWVGDFIHGIRCVLDMYYAHKDRVVNEIFHFGSGERLTNMDLVKIICAIIPNSTKLDGNMHHTGRYELVQDRVGHDLRYALCSQKAKTILGWEPTRKIYEWMSLYFYGGRKL